MFFSKYGKYLKSVSKLVERKYLLLCTNSIVYIRLTSHTLSMFLNFKVT